MTAEHYHALHSWMDAHPTAKRCVVALDRWLPLIPFVCYPVLLCLLNVRLFRLLGSQRQAALDLTAVIARTVFVPGLTFWGGTILRDRLNLPRPYEQPGFEPLRHKETRGHSFPSRHALSASVLAMVWMYFYPKAGWERGNTRWVEKGQCLRGFSPVLPSRGARRDTHGLPAQNYPLPRGDGGTPRRAASAVRERWLRGEGGDEGLHN